MKKGTEVWTDYDRQNIWTLHIKKARGRLTLDEIRDACMEYEDHLHYFVIDGSGRLHCTAWMFIGCVELREEE